MNSLSPSLVQTKLSELEQSEGVRVLFACESGSRAWGFPSLDSDYDVRFIYVHPRDWYLSIDEGRDVIERPLDSDAVDLSGWDLKKALTLLRKSNPPLLEWLNSPIIYLETFAIRERLRTTMRELYSPIACMYHYLHMAQRNYQEFICHDLVRTKKYFYVLRPVLACCWIEAGYGIVPTEFQTLAERILPQGKVRTEIELLLERKRSGEELDSADPIPALNDYLKVELDRLEKVSVAPPPRLQEKVNLDLFFRETLAQVWD